MNAKPTLGSLIREARKSAGLTASDLAHVLGVTPQTVFRWEWDDHEPSVKKLAMIATATDVSLAFFIRSDDGVAV